ncbi:S28A3-like protein [Mya arenaria]|uniref:S28A3-like protein n=1 Tax=Mya arenaria TaxID=6604 RepID=A0ABY7DBV3_MYAAR|nr:S28A3-like protein [Mya arenaria]
MTVIVNMPENPGAEGVIFSPGELEGAQEVFSHLDYQTESEVFPMSKGQDVAEPLGCQKETLLTSASKSQDCLEADRESGSSITDLFQSFTRIPHNVGEFIENNKTKLRMALLVGVGLLAVGYMIWALVVSLRYGCQDVKPLIGLAVIIATCLSIWFLRTRFADQLTKITEALGHGVTPRGRKLLKIGVCVCAVGGILTVLVITLVRRPVIFLHPQVRWRPVLGGFCLQFYFAVVILRWPAGYSGFQWMGQRVQQFLSFTDEGSKFVFGDKFTDHLFAFKVVISKLGWLLHSVLGTTAPESLCAAANIFIGQSEAPIMIRPFMPKMTNSELNAVMTGGFATIAGGVMAAYISFGVAPEHLLCASVMNAPCALAIAKLLYPETETSNIRKMSDVDFGERNERNILEAAAAGASASIKLVANIAANLIAFLAMLAFVNAVLSWLGGYLCQPELSFQMILSYAFMPVAYLMGVPWSDAGVVGELVGIKTFLNEFLAYKELSKYMDNRSNCVGHIISIRSQIIATYALCGFANISAIGIQLGALGPMAPHRRGDLAGTVVRSLLGGVVTGLMTASIAGLLLVDDPTDLCMNSAAANVTMATTLNPNVTLVSSVLEGL